MLPRIANSIIKANEPSPPCYGVNPQEELSVKMTLQWLNNWVVELHEARYKVYKLKFQTQTYAAAVTENKWWIHALKWRE